MRHGDSYCYCCGSSSRQLQCASGRLFCLRCLDWLRAVAKRDHGNVMALPAVFEGLWGAPRGRRR
jgi:hypothetical protein